MRWLLLLLLTTVAGAEEQTSHWNSCTGSSIQLTIDVAPASEASTVTVVVSPGDGESKTYHGVWTRKDHFYYDTQPDRLFGSVTGDRIDIQSESGDTFFWERVGAKKPSVPVGDAIERSAWKSEGRTRCVLVSTPTALSFLKVNGGHVNALPAAWLDYPRVFQYGPNGTGRGVFISEDELRIDGQTLERLSQEEMNSEILRVDHGPRPPGVEPILGPSRRIPDW